MKTKDLSKVQKSAACQYCCPTCGENPSQLEYEINGEKYPQYFNESKGSDMDGLYHDWDELHKCERCKTEYWFTNGVY